MTEQAKAVKAKLSLEGIQKVLWHGCQAKAVKDKKVTRRNSKGALTLQSNTLNMLCSENRNVSDIEEVLLKFKSQFDIVTQKHEESIALICDDEQCETEERWMTHCLEEFLKQ